MHFTRLLPICFKSFVQSTDILVYIGLTGVVVPYGCGKPTLLHPLRLVLGDSAARPLRAP